MTAPSESPAAFLPEKSKTFQVSWKFFRALISVSRDLIRTEVICLIASRVFGVFAFETYRRKIPLTFVISH
jgi:hypothetical protein